VHIDDCRDLNGGGLVTEELPACDQYTIQGDLFSRAILDGGEVPVPLEDAARTMAVIDAVFLAAETGRRERPAVV
jgi:predicted dehydrogenase